MKIFSCNYNPNLSFGLKPVLNCSLKNKEQAVAYETEDIKEERIKNICEFLLKYMPLLFIPFLVGIVSYYGLIEKQLVPIVLNIAISAVLTMVITAFVVESIIKYTRLKKMRNSKND